MFQSQVLLSLSALLVSLMKGIFIEGEEWLEQTENLNKIVLYLNSSFPL